MKKIKMAVSAVAILGAVSMGLAFKSATQTGNLYCAPSSVTVIATEACAGQTGVVTTHFNADPTNGTTASPCGSEIQYLSAGSTCDVSTVTKFDNLGL
jgi:hypothetical protein